MRQLARDLAVTAANAAHRHGDEEEEAWEVRTDDLEKMMHVMTKVMTYGQMMKCHEMFKESFPEHYCADDFAVQAFEYMQAKELREPGSY